MSDPLSLIFNLATRRRSPKRQLVFVDPDDEEAPYWWPAMVVANDDLAVFSQSISNFTDQPGKGEYLVCYFEDGSYSIVSKRDTRPFSPSLPPYSAYRYGPHSHEFKHDRGVQLATLYHEMAMAPDTFAWIRDEERYNPDITALRATIRHRLDGDPDPSNAPSPSSGAEPDDGDDDESDDGGAACQKQDSHLSQDTSPMPRRSVSPTHPTDPFQESPAPHDDKTALPEPPSDAQRPPLARRKTTNVQPDHLATVAALPPTRRIHSSTTLPPIQWSLKTIANSERLDTMSSDKATAAALNAPVSHTDCEKLATSPANPGRVAEAAAQHTADQQPGSRCTCCQDLVSVDKTVVLCTGCLASCDRRLLYAADAEQLLADLSPLDPRAALRAKPKRLKLGPDHGRCQVCSTVTAHAIRQGSNAQWSNIVPFTGRSPCSAL
ncbi:hypothetical protein H4R35_000162 [Dimargaris xerosporica]|nr:hypothetical protein H4R35_000162 [Dimargaris xerosporica]